MSMNMDEIRWGIVGCGDVCEVKSGPGFYKTEHSSLVAVMRRNAEKAEDFAKRHNVPKWYSNAGDLINDPEVNAIYVATPPASHMEYVIKAAEAGKPVYVEKPMGRTFLECQQMIKACEQAGVPLFVAYYRRMLPYFLKVKELLDSGGIGNVCLVNITLFKSPKEDDTDPSSNWRIDPEISGGGHFHDLASHQLDLLSYFFGEIDQASGVTNSELLPNSGEDSISASFQFKSGLIGNGIWTFTCLFNQSKDEVLVIGDKGRISFGCFSDDIPIVLETETDREEFSIPYPEHVQQPLIQTVVDELRGVGKSPSTGITGAHANWVMDRILGK